MGTKRVPTECRSNNFYAAEQASNKQQKGTKKASRLYRFARCLSGLAVFAGCRYALRIASERLLGLALAPLPTWRPRGPLAAATQPQSRVEFSLIYILGNPSYSRMDTYTFGPRL